MKGKSRHGSRPGEAMMLAGLEDVTDGPKNAKITLSFPLSAALPAAFTVQNCRAPGPTSPSHRRRPSSAASRGSDKGSLWKLDATTDVKHRPFKPPRHDSSPSSSSSSPSSSSSAMDLTALARKEIKSPPPLKCSKGSPDAQFHRSPPPRSSNGGSYPGEGLEERHRLANGTASPSETAKILFNLSTVAYQGGDVEQKERGSLKGKHTGGAGPNLQPPPLHLPPPPSEALTPPPLPTSFSTPDAGGLKPELICGVCHRLFSSASSLTVHMRLHRGGRALSCRHCGKAFIHNKRLQSHEATCHRPPTQSAALTTPGLTANLPHLPIRPKEEPLEEGEVRIEGGVVVGVEGVETSGTMSCKKGRVLLVDHHMHAESGELVGGGEDNHHFVKVVDGHIIYFCSVCERSYMTLSSLKRHSNVHSWRRKYPCHFCDKVFALAEYRTKHEVWHTGERRYQCIFCWDAFATYYNLKTHQKAIHGISPGLISSEKTANGGYKQKVNALKLYRLLPMRSQKRPYKTYSDAGLPDGLPLPPGDTSSAPLPLPTNPLSPGELHGLCVAVQPKAVKPDPDDFPDGFPISIGLEQGLISTPTPFSQTDQRKNDREVVAELERRMDVNGTAKMSANQKSRTPKCGRGTEPGMSSVITYGHPKPSVIVHGTAVSSSVIVHSNQVTKSPPSGPCPDASQTSPKAGARPLRNRGESTESQRKRSRDSSDTTEEGSGGGRQETETGRSPHKSPHKSRRSHSRNDSSSSAKHLSSPGGSEAKGVGPLCQITVRIGEEAIVKRSISETDLRRDKSPHPPKTKRVDASPQDAKETRHSHHHHHKHRSHRGSSPGGEGEKGVGRGGGGGGTEGDVRKKSPKQPGKVREYYFRQEVREQGESDGDGEDNLWRPYYAYKPKRKAQAPIQKARSWQRKLHHKRSLRLMRRAERLMDHVTKETQRQEEEEKEEERKMEVESNEREEGQAKDKLKEEEREPWDSQSFIASTGKDDELGGAEASEVRLKSSELSSPSPPNAPLSTSSCRPMGIKRRPWSNDNASECGTCGRWFSSPRKRDKHELSHLLEFVCLHCRAPFPSRDKLEDHQKTQHPKASEPQSLTPKAACGDRGEGTEAERAQEERESRAPAKGTSSPGRLSRRALARHTCPQCHKVCKTSSALTRHIRRHELSSSPEREETQMEQKATEASLSPVRGEQVPQSQSEQVPQSQPEQVPQSQSEQVPQSQSEQVPPSQSIPVISYSTTDPSAINSDCPEPAHRENQSSKVKAEQQTVINFQMTSREIPEDKELNTPDTPVPESETSPLIIKPPRDSPALLPHHPPSLKAKTPEFSPSTLQGVLVIGGSECLDYRAPKKKNIDSHLHRIPSPSCVTRPVTASPNMAIMTSKARVNAATTAVPVTMAPNIRVGCMKREGVIAEKERPGGKGLFLHAGYDDSLSFVQDLRVMPLSRSPSPPSEAQDLTMSSILAREWERKREMERAREKQREREMEEEGLKEREREMERARQREMEKVEKMERERAQHTRGGCQPSQEQSQDSEVTLLVPKEEPISPTPSPQRTTTQTTSSSPLPQRRPPKSPRRSPTAMDLLAQVNRQAHSLHNTPRHPDRLLLPMGTASGSDRPSGHALLLPRARPQRLPDPEPQDNPSAVSRNQHHGQMEAGGYHVQELPLPLIMPGSYRPGKKQEEDLLVSYPAGPLSFGPLGKMLPNGDLAKLPFYADPYQLIYGPQLLAAYPYNLAALPMALNMMAPGGGADKVEPLPFLPALFNYAAAAGPYMGAVPHPLLTNPSLYHSGGGGKKQRDSSNGKP